MSTQDSTRTWLRVLSPGLHTLVVDAGRPSSRSLGIPLGGAADRFALAIGNALLGNPSDAAALEVTLAGPTLEAGGELACVLSGAPFDLASDRQRLQPGTTFTLQPGERLHIRGTSQKARGYLCVQGGLQTPEILGSRTGLTPVQAGEELPCLPGRCGRRFVRLDQDERPFAEGVELRTLPGPQADWYDLHEFHDGRGFVVTPASNRMGLRLQGPALMGSGREMVSEPVGPGMVQVTRDGQCIVLGVDGQTIGGYPRVACVIRADLDRLGQLRPGERVFFRRVSLEEAIHHQRQRDDELHRWMRRLRCVADSDLRALARLAPGRGSARPTT